MASKNLEVLHVWDLATGFTPALTGLQPTMTATLTRFPTSSSQSAATETVTIAEIGSTGFYSITYTPENAQVYKVHIAESTFGLTKTFEDNVLDTPAATVADNAYCTEADVVAWVQLGDYTTSTIPTEAQVLWFMESRAAELYGKLAEVMGSAAVGPAGSTNYSTEIVTTTDVGFALGRFLRMANAIGAAADALQAAGAGESPARSERVSELLALYEGLRDGTTAANTVVGMGTLESLAQRYVGYGSKVATHFTTGEITARTITSRTQADYGITDSTEW